MHRVFRSPKKVELSSKPLIPAELILVIVSLALALTAGSAFAGEIGSPRLCQATETFSLTPEASAQSPVRVDFLWVIDDSSSMAQHQEDLRESVQGLFEGFEARGGVDYQMAITTTSGTVVNEKAGTPLILRSGDSSSQKKRFQDRIMVGTRGNPKETGSRAAVEFFMTHKTFMRPGSNVIVVVLTDEDDSSSPLVSARVEALKQAVRASGGAVHAFVFGGVKGTKNYQENLKPWSPESLSLTQSFDSNLKLIEAEAVKPLNQRFRLAHEPETLQSARMRWASGSIQELREGYEIRIEEQEATISLQDSTGASEFQIVYEYACDPKITPEMKEDRKRINELLAKIRFIGSTNIIVNKTEAHAALTAVQAFLEEHPEVKIQLVGACSSSINPLTWIFGIHEVGNEDYHQSYGIGPVGTLKLSRARARTIRNELVALGVDQERISSRGSWPGFGRHWYSYALDLAVTPYYALYKIPGFFLIDFLAAGGLPTTVASSIKADRRVFMRFR